MRVERYIPYAQLMPDVDVLVTNGGYGTLQIALALPVVAFGKTEEKPEVANQLTYSGAGIGMRVLSPTEQQIRDSVSCVLGDPIYHYHALEIGKALAGLNPAREAADHIEGLCGRWKLARTA